MLAASRVAPVCLSLLSVSRRGSVALLCTSVLVCPVLRKAGAPRFIFAPSRALVLLLVFFFLLLKAAAELAVFHCWDSRSLRAGMRVLMLCRWPLVLLRAVFVCRLSHKSSDSAPFSKLNSTCEVRAGTKKQRQRFGFFFHGSFLQGLQHGGNSSNKCCSRATKSLPCASALLH